MDAAVPRPLIRSDGLRALLALALGLTALLAVPVAWFVTILNAGDWLMPATVAALLAAPFAGSTVSVGRWSRTRELRWLQVAAVVVLLGVGVLVVARGASLALNELSWRAPLITSPETLALGLVSMAGALVAIALLLAAIPLALSKLAAGVLVMTCAGEAALLAGGAVLVRETTVGCSGYELDGARWQREVPGGGNDATLGMAAALARCDTLDGSTRAEVRELLGRPPQASRREWSWQVGWVNKSYGLGDGEYMTVTFDGQGRVRGTHLARGGYAD